MPSGLCSVIISPLHSVISLFFSSFHSHQHTCCNVSLASMSPSYHAVSLYYKTFWRSCTCVLSTVYLLFFVLFSQVFISLLHENYSLSRSSVTSMSSTPVVNFEFSPSFNYQSYWTIMTSSFWNPVWIWLSGLHTFCFTPSKLAVPFAGWKAGCTCTSEGLHLWGIGLGPFPSPL